MADRALTIKWLRGLAEEGGKGVVNNIDARCLGRIADDLERLAKALEQIAEGTTDESYPFRAMGSDQMKQVARDVLRTDLIGAAKQ